MSDPNTGSDVEVLRELKRLSPEIAIAAYWAEHAADFRSEDIERALSSAVSALEAREAQPEVEGRANDDDFADAIAGVAGGARTELVKREALRARASEAALSERVAMLEGAIRPFLEEHDICKPGMCPEADHVLRMGRALKP